MTNSIDPTQLTEADVLSPAIGAADLQQIASARPDLWNAVLRNPNVYPELAQWITAQQGAADAPTAAQGAEQAGQPVGAPAGEPATQPAGATAVAAASTTPQQYAAQGYAGAGLPGSTPVTGATASKVATLFKTAGKVPGETAMHAIGVYALFAVPVLAVLGFALNFLPVVAVSANDEGGSFGWLDMQGVQNIFGGTWLFFIYPALIALVAAAVFMCRGALTTATATVTICVGLFATVSAMIAIGAVNKLESVLMQFISGMTGGFGINMFGTQVSISLGAGLTVQLIFGLLVLIAGVLALWAARPAARVRATK